MRSQDKEHLVKTTDIDLSYEDKTIILINNYEMGKYKTKERALEVLNEIQNKLMPYSEVSHNEENTIINYKNMSIIVYEMPEK